MDVRTALKEAMGQLRQARVPSYTLAAELLLMHVLGRDRAWLYAHPEEAIEPAQAEQFFGLVARRIEGTPTQYLTGQQEFWGLGFEVTPDVLIPRPETEHVIEVVLARLGPAHVGGHVDRRKEPQALRVADVDTGSGCLAVALARELPGAIVFATDVSPAALAVARRNAARHRVGSQIHFVRGNLLDAFRSAPLATRDTSLVFDLIVSNPPYVGRRETGQLPREVREHEPEQALFAGERGGELYAPLICQAEGLLRPGGFLVLELGYHAREFVEPLLGAPAWTNVGVGHDLAGIARVISAARV
jgi:release factor glutamine methyltransferase